jgi:hypothetical protein
MRYVAVALLALAGCGSQSHAQGGEGGQCAAAVVYHDTTYVKVQDTKPALGGRLTGGHVPACNDHEGDPGTDQPVVLRRIKGAAPSDAVYAPKPFPGVYRRAEPQP